MPERRVDVRVAGRITARAGISLADAAAAVDVEFVEAAVLGPVCLLVTEVPFAKMPVV